MDTPNESPAPVVVTPKPASSSRLVWLGYIISVAGGVLALIPELVSQPLVAAWIDAKMSPDARWTIAVAVAAIGYLVQRLRKDTSAPIAGTSAAVNATQFYSPSQGAPARTKGDQS